MVRILFICLVMMLPLRAVAEPVVVFAAASLKGALDEIFEGQDVVVSYGGSGAMAQQIARGAPADIYLSANVAWVDWLGEQGVEGERIDLLSNRLTLITTKEVLASGAGGLAETGAIGLGQTRSVPVGIYARQSLETRGEWGETQPRVIEFPSAPAVLRAVELGEVPFGVVYYSDALHSDNVAILHVIDPATHDTITYPMVLLNPGAAAVFDHLQSDRAAEVFQDFGFVVLADQ